MDASKGQGNISMRFFEPSIQKQDLLQMLALMHHHLQSKPDGEYTLILSIAPATHLEMPSKLTVNVPAAKGLPCDTCPSSPANGGSGVCFCTLGQPTASPYPSGRTYECRELRVLG